MKARNAAAAIVFASSSFLCSSTASTVAGGRAAETGEEVHVRRRSSHIPVRIQSNPDQTYRNPVSRRMQCVDSATYISKIGITCQTIRQGNLKCDGFTYLGFDDNEILEVKASCPAACGVCSDEDVEELSIVPITPTPTASPTNQRVGTCFEGQCADDPSYVGKFHIGCEIIEQGALACAKFGIMSYDDDEVAALIAHCPCACRIACVAAVSEAPSGNPTTAPPSAHPSSRLSWSPSAEPSAMPTPRPSSSPSAGPSKTPTSHPMTASPSAYPTFRPSAGPSKTPTSHPTTASPSAYPTFRPSYSPSAEPSNMLSSHPSHSPSTEPSNMPSSSPSESSMLPSTTPSSTPTEAFSNPPSNAPSRTPVSPVPSQRPTTRRIGQGDSEYAVQISARNKKPPVEEIHLDENKETEISVPPVDAVPLNQEVNPANKVAASYIVLFTVAVHVVSSLCM